MQTEMEKTFRNLKVISVLKQNDKLLTECEIFEIDTPKFYRTAYRTYYRENRETNLMKIQSCIRESTAYIERTISNTDLNSQVQCSNSSRKCDYKSALKK